MAISDALLAEMGELHQPITQVMSSIEGLIDPEYSGTWSNRSVDAALGDVDSSVANWVRTSLQCERQLLAHADELPEDAYAVQARLGAFMMLHITMASDVAKLLPFDEASGDSSVSQVHEAAADLGIQLPLRAYAIREVALGTDGLVQSMSILEETEFGESSEQAAPDAEDDNSGSIEDQAKEAIARADVLKEDLDEIVGDVIDEVVTDLVERAARSSSGVLIGLAGGGMHILADFLPHLSSAINAVPDDVRQLVLRTVKRVARLVRILIARAQAALASVLQGYSAAVKGMMQVADPASLITEAFAGNVVGKIVHSKQVRRVARERLSQASRQHARQKRLKALMKTHRRWVGPVRVVAGGLPHLWAVPVGPIPVPAAPIAAVALLAWTVLITGDQLDSPGYVDFWKGVIRRASGE